MFVDGRELLDDQLVQAQVCVVGSGPVGCAIARELVRKGLQVVVVEAGGTVHDPAAQAAFWSGDAREPDHHPPLHLWRRRMLGGASTVWGGRCLPLSRSDFEDRAWPIDYEEFSAYLPRAADFLEIGTGDFDASTALMPEHRTFLGGFRHGDLCTDTIDRYSPPTNMASRYWVEAAPARNLTVLLNAPCVEIRLDPSGSRADRAIIAPSVAKRIQVRAASFVLAVGGLETARLLLASTKDRGSGLGNENDLVGRYYMTHLVGNLGHLTSNDGKSRRELSFVRTTDGIYAKRNLQLSGTAQRREDLGAFLLRSSIGRVSDPSHGDGVLSALFLGRSLLKNELFTNMARRSADNSDKSGFGGYSKHVANVLRDSPSIVSFGYKWFVDRPRQYRKLPGYDLARRDNAYPLEFNAEQAPNPASRVHLGRPSDPLGVPLLAVDWRSCDADRRTVRRGFELIRDALASCTPARIDCGTEELEAAAADLWPAGGHHIGTARWSRSPREGVVDPDMQVWSVKGLYVAGAAVFPRSGSANPTLSAVATALRLADHLAALHR